MQLQPWIHVFPSDSSTPWIHPFPRLLMHFSSTPPLFLSVSFLHGAIGLTIGSTMMHQNQQHWEGRPRKPILSHHVVINSAESDSSPMVVLHFDAAHDHISSPFWSSGFTTFTTSSDASGLPLQQGCKGMTWWPKTAFLIKQTSFWVLIKKRLRGIYANNIYDMLIIDVHWFFTALD